jgi:hypothetical protein
LSIWLGERLRKSKVALEQGVAERLVGKVAAALDQGAEAFADDRAVGGRSSP